MEKIPKTIYSITIDDELKKKLNSLQYDNVIIDGKLEVSNISKSLHELLLRTKTEEEWDKVYASFMDEINNLDDDDLFNEVKEGIRNKILKKAYLEK